MQIYLDMDGVLADFDQGVFDALGVSLGDIPDEQMQREVSQVPGFWDNIPPMPDMLEIWEFIKPYNPFILSATANWDRERCTASKKWWISKYLPEFDQSRLLLVRRSEKQNYATCETGSNLLIDDYEKNINEWISAGGWGILHVSAKQTKQTFPNVVWAKDTLWNRHFNLT